MNFIVYTDGASRANPGHASSAYVIERDGQTIREHAEYIGVATNNAAEYTALIKALRALRDLCDLDDAVEIRSDSMLVVEQVNGRWRCKEETLKVLLSKALLAWSECCQARITLVYIPREQNTHADRLCNQALNAAGH